MKMLLSAAALVLVASVAGAQTGPSYVHGTVKKIDTASKTVVVAVDKGADQTIHFVDKTVVHGTAAGATDGFHGLKEGSEVVVHYTAKGAQKTAVEVDNLGKDGLKSADGTIEKIDAKARKVWVKTADGVETAYDLTADAASDAAKATADAAKKVGKTTVYYTEEGGKKVVHFWKKVTD